MSDNKTVEEQKSYMLELIYERLQYGSRGGVFLNEEMCREILAMLDTAVGDAAAARNATLEEAAKLIEKSEPDSGSDCCDMAILERYSGFLRMPSALYGQAQRNARFVGS